MTRSRAVAATIAFLALLTPAPSARAADPTPAECISAVDTGVKLRGQGKLLDARDTLVTCTSPKCPATVRSECEKDVEEVNRALPSVVFAPKDASGSDVLTPVKVSMDGKPLADHLDGRAIAVDPGTHEFTFETSGAPPVKKSLMIHEGEKDRRETVSFAAASAAPPAAATPAPAPTTPAPAPAGDTSSSPDRFSSQSSSPRNAEEGEDEGPTASGIEIAIASGYMIPLGSADGASTDSMSNFMNGAVPLRVEAGWRFLSPSIFVGAYFAYAFASLASASGSLPDIAGCNNTGISCSGNVLEVGGEVHAHFLPEGTFDPWVGAGFGYEQATLNASGPGGSASLQVSGLDFLTLMLGGDFKAMGNLGIGPWVGLTLGQYNNISVNTPAQNNSQSITQTAMHEWVTLGLRGVYDINVGGR
jgi:hypothetical protein